MTQYLCRVDGCVNNAPSFGVVCDRHRGSDAERAIRRNDTLSQPQHYTKCKIQPIDYIRANGMDFLEGNVVKYVSRYKHKNGVEDLHKARQYLEWLIERESESK